MVRYILPSNRAFLIAIKGLIYNKNNELLMLKVASDQKDSNNYDLPGGLLEIDETIENALKREVLEETGLYVEVGSIQKIGETVFSNFEFEKGDVRDVRLIVLGYKCKLLKDSEVILSDEHDSFKWFSQKEITDVNLSRPTKGLLISSLES